MYGHSQGRLLEVMKLPHLLGYDNFFNMRKKKHQKAPTFCRITFCKLIFAVQKMIVVWAITIAGVPGQMNWMPAPQAPMGCPPGLEYLTAIDQVLVQQQIELLEGMLFVYSSNCT